MSGLNGHLQTHIASENWTFPPLLLLVAMVTVDIHHSLIFIKMMSPASLIPAHTLLYTLHTL